MRVPVPTAGRVIPKVQDAYVQASPGAFKGASDFVQGVSGFGKSLTALSATFQERDKSTDKFNSLTNLSKFDQDMTESLTELKRGYAPDGKGYTKTAETLYDEKAQQYLSTVPQDLQEEFRYRVQENKKSIIADSLSFQYQAGDAHFKQGVSDELNRARTTLDQNPGALDAQRAHMSEVIDATDLPQIEKEDLKRKVNIGLETATYKAEVRKDASTRIAIGVGDIADFNSGARALILKEEGYVPTAMWDVNHHRVGYSSDTITEADGTVRTVREGDTTTREDADRDLQRRIKDADNAGAKAVGGERWGALGANVKAALASVYYHYGKYPQEVIRAVESGDTKEIASAVRGLSSNPARREREAKIIEGSGGIDVDPRFQNIPYEDRLALRDDADREAAQEATVAAKQKKDLIDAQSNQLYLGLLDGTKGQADIDQARQAGWLTDYDSINKANGILKEANVQTRLAGEAAQKLTGGGVFDPTDPDDKKRLNAYVGKNGLERISNADQDFIHESIVPLVNQTGDIPTDVAGTLIGMVRANDATKAMFALDALAQLRDTNQIAFDSRVSTDVAAQVDMWDSQKALATDQAELLNNVRGGTDQATRQARLNLRNEAKGILSQSQNGVPNAKNLLQQVVGAFDGYFTRAPNLYTNPRANQALEKEFSTLFIDKYSLTGNTQTATDLAIKDLQRTWGVTSAGNRRLLMKYPPEAAGYRPINGSYDWINGSVQKDLGLKPDETFELLSDDRTREDIQNFQKNPSATPPSYRVFTVDADGVSRERVDANGDPARIYFAPPPGVLEEQANTFDRLAERNRVEEVIANYPRLQAGALVSKTEVPEEDTQAYEAALKTRSALDVADAQAQKRTEAKIFHQPAPDSKLSAVENSFLGALKTAESAGTGGTALKLYNSIVQGGRREPITAKDFSTEEQTGLANLVKANAQTTGKLEGKIDYKDYLGSGIDSNILGGFKYTIERGVIHIKDTYDFNKDRADGSEDNVFIQAAAALGNPRGLAASIGRKILPDDGKGVPVNITLRTN